MHKNELNNMLNNTRIALIIVVGCALTNLSCDQKQKDFSGSGLRIVSLSPHITEILYAIGAEDKIIAVTNFCKYPKDALQKEKIGGFMDLNLEKVVQLRPSVVLGTLAHQNIKNDLQQMGIETVLLANESVNDLMNGIKRIGLITSKEQQAQNLILQIDSTFKYYQDKFSAVKKIRAALIVGRAKGAITNMTVAGDSTFISEIWKMCGGENIFSDLSVKYSTINLESLAEREPDVIIEFDTSGEINIIKNSAVNEWENLSSVSAIQKGNIFIVSGDYVLIPGPRVVKLAESFARIHSELSSDNNSQ